MLGILHVGTTDRSGGAARVAANLMRHHREAGCRTVMAVGRRSSDDPTVVLLPDDDRPALRMAGYTRVQSRLSHLASHAPGKGWGQLGRLLRLATHPRAVAASLSGQEDFEFPGTYRLLDLMAPPPDVVHCHNLHGGYFDLRALSWLSHRLPTLLTLHDAWLLSGHCAHPIGCDRWEQGCGACPDLTIYPAIRRDRTAANWIRKRDIYANSRLYATTPCRWLMSRVERSMLGPSLARASVIPNGVDVQIFHPSNRACARQELGLPAEDGIVLIVVGADDPWTDVETTRATLDGVADSMPRRKITFVAVGTAAPRFQTSRAVVRWIARQESAERMARYYQASDVFLHAARAATFPTTVLEALACGTPVVASAVGGVPEQIEDTRTGALAPPGDASMLVRAITAILIQPGVAREMGACAAREAGARFSLDRMSGAYLEWYRAIIEHWNGRCPPRPASRS